jgi:hypothetical protein
VDDKGNPTYNTSALAAALKGYKVSTGQVWGQDEHGKGANRRGLVRADLLAAIDSRRQAQIAASRAIGYARVSPTTAEVLLAFERHLERANLANDSPTTRSAPTGDRRRHT